MRGGIVEETDVDVVFLGTNGWYDSETGNTACVLVRTPEWAALLDAGNGIRRLDRYHDQLGDIPLHLLVSHFHLDHTEGLHVLCKFRFRLPLLIGGPAHSRRHLGVLLDEPWTMPMSKLPYETRVFELPEEASAFPFLADVRPLRHSQPTLGFRLEHRGRSVCYCPDTGYCDNAVALARGADLLVAECALPPGVSNESWPHLNPETAARIASEAGVGRLALFHFEAERYPTFQHREAAGEAARKVFPETRAARDCDVFEVGG